jgi:hypothetical protein
VRLSRTPLDLVAGASHRTKNHPIETPQLSLPPCPMRVDLASQVTVSGNIHGLEEKKQEFPHSTGCSGSPMDLRW